MKKKNYFIGLFLIVTTLLFTMVSSVEANNQIENEFQTNNILTQFKLQNNLWYSGNQINNLNSTLDRLTSNLEFQQSNTNNLSPNIEVKLSSVTPTRGPNGQEVEVTYTITLGDFTEYISNNSNHSSIVEEAVFIFDTSSNMNQNAWNSAIRNGIVRNINDSSDIKNSGMKIGLIGYNSSVVYANDDENTANLYDYSKPEEVEKLRVLLQEEKIRIDWNNSSRNITDALKKANSILSQSSDDKEKAIVIISTDKIQADSEIIKQIKSQGYRIISFYLGNVGSNVTDSYSLEDLHYQLGGVEEHYIITSFDQGNCNNAFNDMQKVRDSLLGLMGEEKVDTYKLDLMLNFDLGDGFLPVRGITQKQGTLYQVNIPSITYTPVTKNDDGTYTYEADQKQIEVSFTVKVDTNQIGDITFSNKDDVEFNNLTYTNLNDEEIKARIETPTFTVVGETELPTYSNDTIKILEIEPADYFQLGSSQVLETGTEKLEVNGEVIEITRMTMPEFIGKAEKINGKYDVVVIGRLVNTDWGDDPKNQSRYQDYRFERSNDSEENDITNRKAQEIIDFIDSGQLVYLDREIYDESIEATKLYRNFIDKNGNPITGSNLITSETIKELTVEKIFEKYQTISYRQKQVDLTVVDNTPSDITTDDLDSADGIPSNRNRTMTVNIPIKENGEAENVELKLYLDLNGDGLFSDDEVAAQRTDLVTPLNDFELNYSIHPDFIGLLSWKLEVTKGDSNHPIKTYITGNMNFHRLPGQPKKVIRVLQISNNENFMYADEEGTKSKPYDTLDLSRNTNFQQLLKQKELKDYEFSITIISLSAYNSIMKGEELPSWYPEAYQLSESEKLGIRKLNGYYDMVILGFADNYTNLGKDILEDKALNQLQNYVDTGQGLMLTHDTILYNEGNIEKLPSEGYKMLERFRVLSGQSRYAPLNQKIDSSIMFDPDRLEGISSDVCNSGETEEEKKINAAKCIMYSGGTTATLMNKWGSQEWGTQAGNMSTLSTMVYGINQALITSYPFNLIDNVNNTIAIRRTHGQYLQLNLEDEEVVPWFTNTYYNENNEGTHKDTEQYEVDNKINPYDVRNNYYTYSRKNITYSGTGEQKREYTQYPQSELMLFVNTIIKAERGANHAPSFEVKNLYNGMLVSDKQDTLIFDVIPYDMDLDNMRIEIEAYGCTSDHSCDTKIGDFKDNGDQYPRLNGESILVSLSIKDKVSLYETLQIRVKVIDERGAESETVVYTVKVTDYNLLEISLNSEGYLIGDIATLTANIKSVSSKAVDGSFSLNNIPSLVTLRGDKNFNFELDKNEAPSSTFHDYQFEVVNSDSIQTGNSTPVTISANYSYCLGEDSSSCARIEGTREGVINVKRGQIVLNFSSDVANLFGVEVQLLDVDGELVESETISRSNNVIFDAVPSGEYKIKIQSLEDYLLYELSDEEAELLEWEFEQKIAINYNNNVVIKNYFIDKASVGLVHGIFESQRNQAITIKETTYENPEVVNGNTLVNFGATFTTTRISREIVLNVSEMLNDFNVDNIKVLKVDKESSELKLVPILGATVTEHQNVKTMFNIQLPNDIQVGTEILIFYTGLVPNDNIPLLTNTILVGATMKDVSIGIRKNEHDEGIANSYLPDLF